MSRTFLCDRCSTSQEGSPYRIVLSSKKTQKLCESCYAYLVRQDRFNNIREAKRKIRAKAGPVVEISP
jgi:hypothetical protein